MDLIARQRKMDFEVGIEPKQLFCGGSERVPARRRTRRPGSSPAWHEHVGIQSARLQRDIRRTRRKRYVRRSHQNLRPASGVQRQDKVRQGQTCAIEFRPCLRLDVERGPHKRLRRRRRQRPVKNGSIGRIKHTIGLDHGLRPQLCRTPRKLHAAALRRCAEFYVEALVLFRNPACEAVSIPVLRGRECSINACQDQRFGLARIRIDGNPAPLDFEARYLCRHRQRPGLGRSSRAFQRLRQIKDQKRANELELARLDAAAQQSLKGQSEINRFCAHLSGLRRAALRHDLFRVKVRLG